MAPGRRDGTLAAWHEVAQRTAYRYRQVSLRRMPPRSRAEMRRLGLLALDFDGTLADEGCVGPEVRAALGAARAGGVPIVVLTGRFLEDLREAAGDLSWADAVVAESGAVVAFDGGHERVLGPPPSTHVVEGLRRAGVAFDVGRCVVAADAAGTGQVLPLVRELAAGRSSCASGRTSTSGAGPFTAAKRVERARQPSEGWARAPLAHDGAARRSPAPASAPPSDSGKAKSAPSWLGPGSNMSGGAARVA
jgi:hypothetical protein